MPGQPIYSCDESNFVLLVQAQKRGLPLAITMDLKCRQCRRCLKLRAAQWRNRAEAEILAAPRTWFGTLTLAPEHQALALYRAQAHVSARGSEWLQYSASAQFAAVHSQMSQDLTRWLKRIRKESNAKLRYCLVAERHKSGNPHFHVLVHEVPGGGSVKERTLRQQWKLGHSKFNLVKDKGAAGYVSKYLSKSALARVRSSLDYGNPSIDIREALLLCETPMPHTNTEYLPLHSKSAF